jgi:anti-sigma factor RsiW
MDMMDCEQVKELLDAYALGAAEPEEAAALEEHMEDCARCWHSFNEAQRAAAAIALSATLCRAPESLRRNVLAEIERMQRSD